MLKQNDTSDIAVGARLLVDITGYTHDGRGVARHMGRVIFVPGAITGESVEVEITGCRKKIFSGKIVRVVEASAERVKPVCPVFEECGGCQMQHMTYAAELRFKQGQVQAAMERIAGLGDVALRPIIGAAEQLHYRNKGVFHITRTESGNHLSFWDEGTHSPAGEYCRWLFADEMVQVAAWLQAQELPVNISDVMLRRSGYNGEMMLAAILTDEDRARVLPLLGAAQQQFAKITVAATQTRAGWQVHTAAGTITDALAGTMYQLSPPAFFQVNGAQTERLLATVAELLGDCRVLIDAYCGIGTIGLYLAAKMPGLQRLIGIEINESAVKDARSNAGLNGIVKAEFFAGKAEELFARVLPDGEVDAVIVDPPRRGCHADLLRGLLALRPPRIVYVSCNPATLARDLACLTEGGYAVQVVQPVDMFPRTHHVETVVLLSR